VDRPYQLLTLCVVCDVIKRQKSPFHHDAEKEKGAIGTAEYWDFDADFFF
jgi:hypothetical protein